MDYICPNCGNTFNDGEQKVSREAMGYMGDELVYQDWSYCPYCGETGFEEAKKCRRCCEDFLEDYLTNGYCDDCAKVERDKYKYDYKGCYEIAKSGGDKQEVELNGFLATLFTPQQIEEVLLKELFVASAYAPVDCTPYIEGDEGWFTDAILKEVKK